MVSLLLPLAALLLPLAALAAPAFPPAGSGKSTPAWVDRFPNDPDRYIGIGRADKRAHPLDYRDLAQAAALAQISREISIEVKAENSATVAENGSGWEETYSQRIATASRNELTGYELEDSYETCDGFWVLYALDKEAFRKARAENETRIAARLEGESAALDGDLRARRIQAAVDRYAGMEKEYAANPSKPIRGRFTAAAGKILSALGNPALSAGPSEWVFTLALAAGPKAARTVEISLKEDGDAAPWKGPLSLILSEPGIGASATCEIETDSQGRLDLALPFLECGLHPGRWRLTWKGPAGRSVQTEVDAAWQPIDLSVTLRTDGIAAPEDLVSQLKSALPSLRGPAYHTVAGNRASPNLEIRLREAVRDSLDGMYFSSLRAEVVIPGLPGARTVCGKAGHAEKGRADARAVGDFIRGVESMIPSGK